MKHLLNNLSEHEKNHIREQHTDKIKIDTSKFRRLMESKLGDVRPIMEGPGEGTALPQTNAAVTSSNQPIEIPKGAQEPEAFEGKSITLYRDENDAKKAFESKTSNPRSFGSIAGVISKIQYAMDKGVEFDINVYNLAKDPNGVSVATPVIYVKERGAFEIPSRGDMDFYNEGLKQALDKKYYQTDFASTQKPMGTMTEQKTNQTYKVGQTLMGKRSTDNQMYEIKIVELVNDGSHVVAKIKGPGKYEGKKLDGVTGSWELNTNEPGKLSGNMEMGTFELMKKPFTYKKLTEQENIGGPKRNIEKDLERDDVLHLMDKNNSKDEAIVLQSPQPNQGLLVNHKGKKTQFVFGPANNQVRFAGKTEPGDFDFTIDSVEINGKSFPVSSDGSF